jgi:hypothetical protein
MLYYTNSNKVYTILGLSNGECKQLQFHQINLKAASPCQNHGDVYEMTNFPENVVSLIVYFFTSVGSLVGTSPLMEL